MTYAEWFQWLWFTIAALHYLSRHQMWNKTDCKCKGIRSLVHYQREKIRMSLLIRYLQDSFSVTSFARRLPQSLKERRRFHWSVFVQHSCVYTMIEIELLNSCLIIFISCRQKKHFFTPKQSNERPQFSLMNSFASTTPNTTTKLHRVCSALQRRAYQNTSETNKNRYQ